MKISNPTARMGEDLAANFLKKKGYKIIDRNFRLGYGEIDIIAVKKNTLVFVEVKTRRGSLYGTPFEQISSNKLRTIVRTAQFYKLNNPKLPGSLRIDAIGVILDENMNLKDLQHIENITL
ncbi:MAG: hypothetical protein A3A51_04900 [Candidatus Levybacteria bacterium RIFCSPLOWO2_01_FULL_39_10]|nr:MAG: hypothetical protein A3A51_04900 [Candidatus Levybacteria bacterium RIFCSPLOWO2_01_FULL_39_10]